MLAEAGGGFVLSATSGILLGRVLHIHTDSSGRGLTRGELGTNAAIDIGLCYPVGCAVGMDIVGTITGNAGNFWYGYFGAVLGTGATFGIAALTGNMERLEQNIPLRPAPAVLAAAVGVLGYNYNNATLAPVFEDSRLLPPDIRFGRVADRKGNSSVAFDLHLLNLRF